MRLEVVITVNGCKPENLHQRSTESRGHGNSHWIPRYCEAPAESIAREAIKPNLQSYFEEFP